MSLRRPARVLQFLQPGARDGTLRVLRGRQNTGSKPMMGKIAMKTAIRTLALAGIVGFTMLAGDVSTAKAGPYWNRPGYRHYYPGYRAYAYPYAYTPYAYSYPDYSAGYYPGYYGYASPGVYVGGGWGGRGYWGHGAHWGRGGHWRR